MQWVPRTRLPDGYLVTKRWPYLGHTWNQSLMNTSSDHASPWTDASQHSHSLQDLLERLIHGVTYSRVIPITEDTAIDRLITLCRGSALYPHHRTDGLALPFGWTNGITTELSHFHDTLTATPTNYPLGLVLGDRASDQRQNNHRRGK